MKEEYVVIEKLLVPCNVKNNKNGLPTSFMKTYQGNNKSIQPLDDLLKGCISKLHIIHINSTLQICAYPNLHHNVHYTINDTNIMKEIIKKNKKI